MLSRQIEVVQAEVFLKKICKGAIEAELHFHF